jgi:hypothetical protein
MCIHPRACVRCLCTSMRPAWHVHERLHGIRTVRPLCTDSSSTFITEEGGTHWMLKMSRASGGTSEADARPMFGLSDAAPARTAPPILNTVPERIGLKRPPRPQSALGTTVPASPFLISRVVCVRLPSCTPRTLSAVVRSAHQCVCAVRRRSVARLWPQALAARRGIRACAMQTKLQTKLDRPVSALANRPNSAPPLRQILEAMGQ